MNRYYDPVTGQFLSLDPLVDETGQSYAYTGDDPVDGVDPSGLCWNLPAGSEGPCPPAPSGVNYNSSCTSGNGSSTLGSVQCGSSSVCGDSNSSDGFGGVIDFTGHGLDIAGGGLGGWSDYNNALGEYGAHIGDDGLLGLAESSIEAGTAARALGPLGASLTIGVDISQGHGVPYAVGDAGSSATGAWAGAALGAAACGGPEDGVGILCGAAGAFVGGGGVHWLYSKIF